jgi:hypothetical protein
MGTEILFEIGSSKPEKFLDKICKIFSIKLLLCNTIYGIGDGHR